MLVVLASETNPASSRLAGDRPPQRLIGLGDWAPQWPRDDINRFESSKLDLHYNSPFEGDRVDKAEEREEDEEEVEFAAYEAGYRDENSEVYNSEEEDSKEEDSKEERGQDDKKENEDNKEDGYNEDKNEQIKGKSTYRHITISRDQTKASSFAKDQLVVLQSEARIFDTFAVEVVTEGLRQAIVGDGLADYTLQLMLLAQQKKKRLFMARREQDAMQDFPTESPGSQTIMLESTDVTTAIPATTREHISFKGQRNVDQIAQLEEEIQKLRSLQRTLGSTSWHILHKIQDEEAIYLVEPSWTLGQGGDIRLRGNSPLSDELGFLRQTPGVAFAVYKNYKHNSQLKAIQLARAEGAMLPQPVPVSESIRLLSEQMIAALDAFLDAQPTFKKDFPKWNSKHVIESPFLFWYHYRSVDCLEAIPEPHRSQMRLLTSWIDENYNDVYTEAEDQFARGYVSSSTMPFFVRPGEVLVLNNHNGIQGYIAET